MKDKMNVPILKAPEDILRTPECIECFDIITKHSDSVLKEFETKSEHAISSFIGQTSEMFAHLKLESATYFKDREEKSDEFYQKQEQKYDKLETKLTGMVKWILMIVLFIVTIYGGVIATTYVQGQEKADAKDVLSLKDAYTIRTLGDKYYDQRYVIKSGETVDKSTYEWHMSYIFETLSRGGKIKSLPIRPMVDSNDLENKK